MNGHEAYQQRAAIRMSRNEYDLAIEDLKPAENFGEILNRLQLPQRKKSAQKPPRYPVATDAEKGAE